jgi:FkbM family methyltransferase
MCAFLSIINYIWNYPPNKGQRLKRLALFFFWQCFKRTIKRPIVNFLDNGMRYMAYPQSHGASFPFYSAEYDYPQLRFVRKCLSGKGTIIDVGANIGLYSLSLANYCDKALLFEPDPDANHMLKELNKRFFLIEAAAGECDKIVHFTKKGIGGLTNHVSDAGETAVYQKSIDTTLREYNNILQKSIEYVKIDVEGYELNVLKGMKYLINSDFPPQIIQFERLKNTPIIPLLSFFREQGWTVFALDMTGISNTDNQVIEMAHDLFATKEYLQLQRNVG